MCPKWNPSHFFAKWCKVFFARSYEWVNNKKSKEWNEKLDMIYHACILLDLQNMCHIVTRRICVICSSQPLKPRSFFTSLEKKRKEKKKKLRKKIWPLFFFFSFFCVAPAFCEGFHFGHINYISAGFWFLDFYKDVETAHGNPHFSKNPKFKIQKS